MTTIFFYSQSCPSCQLMKADVEKLLPQATWQDVEADNWASAEKYDIWGVPALVDTDGDSVLKSYIGYLNKTKLKQW